MIVPGASPSPSPDQPAAPAADPAPSPQRPSPQEGVLPETLQQSPLDNSDHFSPDESPAPQAPAQLGEWDVFKAKLELAAIDSPTATLGREFMEPTGPSMFEMAKGGASPDSLAPVKPKLTPEQANQLYPGMPKPFDEPVDPDSAQRIAALQQHRNELRDIIVQGPAVGRGIDALVGAAAGALAGSPSGLPGAIGGAVAGGAFAAVAGSESVIVGMADPLNAALMLATGGLAKPIGVLGRNLVINAASAAASAPERIRERQDLSVKDEALNIVGGAIGSTALHVGLKLALGGYSRGPKFTRQADVYTQQKMLETAIAQHEMGAKVDMTASTVEMQRRASGQTEGTPTTYEFKPVVHPSDRTYYAAVAPETGSPVELEDFGPGIHASDNGMVANNLASAPESPNTGSVQEIKIQEGANFLDLNDQFSLTEFSTAKGSTYLVNEDGTTKRNKAARPEHPGEFGPQKTSERTFYVDKSGLDSLSEFQTIGDKMAIVPIDAEHVGIQYRSGKDKGKFERRTVVRIQKSPAVGLTPIETWKNGESVHFGNDIVDVKTSELTAKEFLRSATDDVKEAFHRQTKARGFDGYKYVQESNGSLDNRLFLFSPDKADLGEEFKANKEVTPRMSMDESTALTERTLDPSNSRLYQPGLDEKISAAQKQPSLSPDQETTEAKQTFTNHMAFLKEIANTDPSLASDPAYKELMRMHAQGKQESAIAKALADCMTGDFDESVSS